MTLAVLHFSWTRPHRSYSMGDRNKGYNRLEKIDFRWPTLLYPGSHLLDSSLLSSPGLFTTLFSTPGLFTHLLYSSLITGILLSSPVLSTTLFSSVVLFNTLTLVLFFHLLFCPLVTQECLHLLLKS